MWKVKGAFRVSVNAREPTWASAGVIVPLVRVGGSEGCLIDQDTKLRGLSIRGTTTPSKRSLANRDIYTHTQCSSRCYSQCSSATFDFSVCRAPMYRASWERAFSSVTGVFLAKRRAVSSQKLVERKIIKVSFTADRYLFSFIICSRVGLVEK